MHNRLIILRPAASSQHLQATAAHVRNPPTHMLGMPAVPFPAPHFHARSFPHEDELTAGRANKLHACTPWSYHPPSMLRIG